MPIEEFIAKPVVVSAIRWTGDNLNEIKQFCNGLARYSSNKLVIETTEGSSVATVGDYIVRGTEGEFYPVKPRVMHNKYDLLKEKAARIVKNLGL